MACVANRDRKSLVVYGSTQNATLGETCSEQTFGKALSCPFRNFQEGVTTSMRRTNQVLAHERTSLRPALNKLACILVTILSAVLCVHAQQTDDVQKQIQQLKQQYEQTTRELQERIAALEQQLKNQETTKEDPPKKQAASAVAVAVQDAANAALGQSKENQALQGHVPAA